MHLGIIVMQQLIWTPEMTLGIPEVDKAHQSLLLKLSDIVSQPELDFNARYLALLAELEQDFREEEEIMTSIQYDQIIPHRQQHARVLHALRTAIPDVRRGLNGSALLVLQSLPKWFLFHLKSMDTRMAIWFNVKRSDVTLDNYITNIAFVN